MSEKTRKSHAARPSQRVMQREDTRQRLLCAARRNFTAQGVEGVSMEEIATEAGVSRAALYLHFPGKPALLEALLEEDWAGQVKLFEKLHKIDFGDDDALHRWLARVAEGMRKARDSFPIHRAALGHNANLTLKHQQHRTELAAILLHAARGDPWGPPSEMDQEIAAELIVAEIEYFATAAVIGWSAAQFTTAFRLVARRLADFARGLR